MDFISPPDNRAKAKLAKLSQEMIKDTKHPLPPEIMSKLHAENRRWTLLKYALAVLLGIVSLIIATIIDAQPL